MHITLPKEQSQLLIWQKDQINGHIFLRMSLQTKRQWKSLAFYQLSHQKIRECIDSSAAIFLPSHLSVGQCGSVTLIALYRTYGLQAVKSNSSNRPLLRERQSSLLLCHHYFYGYKCAYLHPHTIHKSLRNETRRKGIKSIKTDHPVSCYEPLGLHHEDDKRTFIFFSF